MHLTGRKIFLFGFIAVLLIGIPVTIYLVQKQQNTQTHAEKTTTLVFTPDSTQAPLQKNVGDLIPLDIYVEPGTNLVSFVKFEIQYDATKLQLSTSPAGFVSNPAVLPITSEGPVYTPGKIAVSLSVGPDPTKAIQTRAKAGTLNFKALAATPPGTPTLVTYGTNTQALSAGPNDQPFENVFSSAQPAAIVIGGAGPVTVTPSVAPVTSTPVPPTSVPTAVPTTAPIIAPTRVPTAIPFPTAGGGGPSASAQAPVCSSLDVDRSTTGQAPLVLTFTANGSDADGTISKVTFNFGDGQVVDVTSSGSGGLGTAAVNAASTHTYSTPGTYTASAILTDNSSRVSNSASCKQVVAVSALASVVTAAPVDNTATTPAPSLAPTGSVETAVGIGAVVLAFIVGGGFLFFFI